MSDKIVHISTKQGNELMELHAPEPTGQNSPVLKEVSTNTATPSTNVASVAVTLVGVGGK